MIDFSSPVWKEIDKLLSARLDELRKKNDDLRMDHETTCVNRGRISMIKELLALPQNKVDQAKMAMPQDPNSWE